MQRNASERSMSLAMIRANPPPGPPPAWLQERDEPPGPPEPISFDGWWVLPTERVEAIAAGDDIVVVGTPFELIGVKRETGEPRWRVAAPGKGGGTLVVQDGLVRYRTGRRRIEVDAATGTQLPDRDQAGGRVSGWVAPDGYRLEDGGLVAVDPNTGD
jgi:hypothetical protein